jgi:hypothetical protein
MTLLPLSHSSSIIDTPTSPVQDLSETSSALSSKQTQDIIKKTEYLQKHGRFTPEQVHLFQQSNATKSTPTTPVGHPT